SALDRGESRRGHGDAREACGDEARDPSPSRGCGGEETMTEQERDGWTQKAAEHVKRYPPGPWHDEPHRKDFKHAGLACLLSRSPGSGGWCGYVGVPPDHPLHGKHYHDDECNLLDVHD